MFFNGSHHDLVVPLAPAALQKIQDFSFSSIMRSDLQWIVSNLDISKWTRQSRQREDTNLDDDSNSLLDVDVFNIH